MVSIKINRKAQNIKIYLNIKINWNSIGGYQKKLISMLIFQPFIEKIKKTFKKKQKTIMKHLFERDLG